MIKISTYIRAPYKGDYRTVEFEDSERNIYSLDSETFFEKYGVKKEYKDYLKTFFDAIKDNPLFSQFMIELNEKNGIVEIIELPMLNHNLTEFYIKNPIIDNFALATGKFGRFVDNRLEYMNAFGTGLFHEYSHNNELINDILKKQNLLITELKSQNNKVITLKLKQHWRLAIGMGNASAYNNGFTFHPVFGIPYIPGQNVKGILRNYIINEYFSDISRLDDRIINDNRIKSKKEYLAEQDPVFCFLFGCSDNSYDNKSRNGVITFTDAFPINKFNVEPDIMNPHYVDYYSDEKDNTAPHDALSPVPVIFLTLKNAVIQFNFYLNNNENIIPDDFEFKIIEKNEPVNYKYQDYNLKSGFFKEKVEIATLLAHKLKEALKIQGIGAKTGVGYGRFLQQKTD